MCVWAHGRGRVGVRAWVSGRWARAWPTGRPSSSPQTRRTGVACSAGRAAPAPGRRAERRATGCAPGPRICSRATPCPVPAPSRPAATPAHASKNQGGFAPLEMDKKMCSSAGHIFSLSTSQIPSSLENCAQGVADTLCSCEQPCEARASQLYKAKLNPQLVATHEHYGSAWAWLAVQAAAVVFSPARPHRGCSGKTTAACPTPASPRRCRGTYARVVFTFARGTPPCL